MISIEVQGAVTVVTPDGPLVGDALDELVPSVTTQLDHGLPMVVFDLSAAPLVDSLGLEAVLDLRDAVRARGGGMKLAGPTPVVSDALLASGVGSHFEIFGNARAAVGSFAR